MGQPAATNRAPRWAKAPTSIGITTQGGWIITIYRERILRLDLKNRWTDHHSVFDNGGTDRGDDETSAPGIVLELDYRNMKVTLDKEFLLYNSTVSQSQGNAQILVNGNALIRCVSVVS